MGRYDQGYDDDGGGWAPYVPVAQRRQQAERKAAALKKKGQVLQPVLIQGRTLARSFWGKAWCDKLEAYSDYANRLPRGRTYVSNGSVIDLRVGTGEVQALVSGSELYRVHVRVQPLPAPLWSALVEECSGKVDSLIELLQGRLSKAVMEVMTRPGQGLFPLPREIGFDCSCPDSARLCKHVAATLYGVGARLDDAPELLFRLRHVDPGQLFQRLGGAASVVAPGSTGAKARLQGADLSALFGIELSDDPAPVAAPPAKAGQAPTAKAPTSKSPKPAKAPKALPARTARPAVPSPASAPAPAPAALRKPERRKLVSAAELIERGIPRHRIQAWLATGVLLSTERRGQYQSTPHTAAHIRAYQAQRAKKQWRI
jgi:uncharacterized Zn finger protein